MTVVRRGATRCDAHTDFYTSCDGATQCDAHTECAAHTDFYLYIRKMQGRLERSGTLWAAHSRKVMVRMYSSGQVMSEAMQRRVC